MKTHTAGIISMGAYLPAKEPGVRQSEALADHLKRYTLLPEEYIDSIRSLHKLPGRIETNYDGWESRPWFEAWLENIPAKKRKDPFQGTKERRRVPMDPKSVRESIVPHPMLPSDAETIASALALVNGDIDKDEIDLLITASQVPDLVLPDNPSLVQHKLKLGKAGAYSIDTCCSSFVTMLEVASAMVLSGLKRKVLIVASYLDSHVNDKSTYFSVDTGDAAVAAVVSRVEEGYGFIASHSTSHGGRHDGIILQRRSPHLFKASAHGGLHDGTYITFHNPEAISQIASNARSDMIEVVAEALRRAGLLFSDIDFFVTHQPVSWAADAWREALGIPEHKFYESFKKYANIANCSAPVNLLEAIELNKIKAGDIALIASSGAGENHIAVLEKITPQLIRSLKRDA